MRTVWIGVLLACAAATLALFVMTARGTLAMPLGLLLAVPALLLARLAWTRSRQPH